MSYLDMLRSTNNLPDFAVGGIRILVGDSGIFSPHYDVYISLGDNKFVYYKEISFGKFRRYKDISQK
jgi:hypothetical protein